MPTFAPPGAAGCRPSPPTPKRRWPPPSRTSRSLTKGATPGSTRSISSTPAPSRRSVRGPLCAAARRRDVRAAPRPDRGACVRRPIPRAAHRRPAAAPPARRGFKTERTACVLIAPSTSTSCRSSRAATRHKAASWQRPTTPCGTRGAPPMTEFLEGLLPSAHAPARRGRRARARDPRRQARAAGHSAGPGRPSGLPCSSRTSRTARMPTSITLDSIWLGTSHGR